MRYSESEIVEDVLEHIRQSRGGFCEWYVGTARNGQLPVVSGLATDGPSSELIYREAYTTFAAKEVVERLQASGLLPDRTSLCASGDIVFAYPRVAAKSDAPASFRAIHRSAA